MRMTQGVVDYRSTDDQKAGLHQVPPPGAGPAVPVPGQGQPGWYAPPPPQQGGPLFAPPPGPYGAPQPNPYAQPAPQGQGPGQPAAAPVTADRTEPEDPR
ncbi:ABC transporter domain-containing protein OS=Streptomyces fumanus OX=67302 GN=GCM10018772_51550 PE=4 SV=1 [Streptomyces fumanus]